MNTSAFSALVCGVVCLSAAAPQVLAADASKPVSTDEELLALSRAKGVSVFVDATDSTLLDEKKAPLAPLERGGNWIWAMAFGRGLAALEQDGCVLFWPGADIVALASRVRAGESVRRVSRDPSLDQKASRDPMGDLQSPVLLQYLRERPRDKLDFDVSVSDLPTEVRRSVIAEAQNRFLDGTETRHYVAWLDDSFWNGARLSWQDAGPFRRPTSNPALALRSGASPPRLAPNRPRSLSLDATLPPAEKGGRATSSGMLVAVLAPDQVAALEDTP